MIGRDGILGHMSESVKHLVDLLSLGALVGTLINILPAMTAALVLIWTGMRIIESYQAIKLNHRKLRGRDD